MDNWKKKTSNHNDYKDTFDTLQAVFKMLTKNNNNIFNIK